MNFQLQGHLDYLYENKARKYAFGAQSGAEFREWQANFRQELMGLMGIAERELPQKPNAEKIDSIDRGNYVEEKYALDVGELVAPMFVLVPKTPPPYKPILAFHGHGPGVQFILGNYDDPAMVETHRAKDENFAQRFAQDGYLVIAVEQRGFGERITPQMGDYGNACRHLSFEYMLEGRSMLGERIWDGMVAISYVQNRDDIVPDTVGCTGHSGGGTTALFLTAVDERVTVSTISCYFCGFRHSILGMHHCECNYLAGLLALGDAGDVASLIAPRPMRFINGQNDPIFPIAGVHEQFPTVKQAYEVFDAGDNCTLAIHPGEHAYHYASSCEWMEKYL